MHSAMAPHCANDVVCAGALFENTILGYRTEKYIKHAYDDFLLAEIGTLGNGIGITS